MVITECDVILSLTYTPIGSIYVGGGQLQPQHLGASFKPYLILLNHYACPIPVLCGLFYDNPFSFSK